MNNPNSPAELHTYWNERGRARINYRGNFYYTITPLPYYIGRKEKLLQIIKKELELISHTKNKISLLDFGCGDGEYSHWIKKNFPDYEIFGCDLSSSMIDRAIQNVTPNQIEPNFKESDSTIPFTKIFDVILVIAVFAHVLDNEILSNISKDIFSHLHASGKVILFESVGLNPRKGNTWIRRKEIFYEQLFHDLGLKLERKYTVSYPFYTILDRYVSRTFRIYFKFLLKIIPEHLKYRRIITAKSENLNNSRFFLLISEVIFHISKLFNRFFTPVDGNTLFIFTK